MTSLPQETTTISADIDVKQRFLRRLWLLEHIPLLLREAQYHKQHQAAESAPSIALWRSGEPEGTAKVREDNSH